MPNKTVKLISSLISRGVAILAETASVGPHHRAASPSGFSTWIGSTCTTHGTPRAAASHFCMLVGDEAASRAALRKLDLDFGP